MKKESTASPVASVDVEAVIASGDRQLAPAGHPFYQRWLDGSLQAGELTAYAAQYRYFEAQLPGFLGEGARGVAAGSGP